jgi:hypothetical protein
MFLVTIQNSVIQLELDIENALQPYPGDYPATFTIFSIENPDLESTLSVTFTIECDAKFATAKLITRPEPKI